MTEITKILDKKVGNLTLLDGALIGASKLGSEMVLARIPFVGNGTLKSGALKVGSAIALSMVGGNRKPLRIVTTGVLIDGMEDLVLGAKRYFYGKTANQSQEVSAFN